MGNHNSAGSGGGDAGGMAGGPDNPELFRRQSIRKSSVGYAAPSANITRAKRFMERELNKSHSLHDLDVNPSASTKKTSTVSIGGKDRRQSTANEASTRKRSTASRLNGVANISTNNSGCTSRASPAPFAGGVGYGDLQEDQYINGFGSTMASSSPTSSSGGAFQHTRTASTHSTSGGTAGSSTTSGATRQKSVKRSEAQSHPISVSGREIIQFCFENAPLDFGTRMCTRIYEKRPDYQRFSQQLGREKWYEMTHALRDFLQRAIAKIDNLEAVEKMARKYGEDHLPLKSCGFKPDFWVTLADLLTVEGVMLDQATHTHTEAVTAWSLFISILFSSIRDGYYSAMREQRNSVRKRSNARQASVGGTSTYSSQDLSAAPTSPPVAGFQQLQIPSAGDMAGGGGFSASGSSSPIEVGGQQSHRRSSRGSSVRVSGGVTASRKSSVAGFADQYGMEASSNLSNPCLRCFSLAANNGRHLQWRQSPQIPRTLADMEIDAVQHTSSQKTAPLFKIAVENIVPSTLHTFLGLVSDTIKSIFEQVSKATEDRLVSILESHHIRRDPRTQQPTGNHVHKLLTCPDIVQQLRDAIPEDEWDVENDDELGSSELSIRFKILSKLGDIQHFAAARFLTDAEIDQLEEEISELEKMAFELSTPQITPKAQALFRHVVPFCRKHGYWGRASEQPIESLHAQFNKPSLCRQGSTAAFPAVSRNS